MSEQSTSGPNAGMDKFFAALRGLDLRRNTDDKWIAGVCSGLADRLGIDPVIVRAALILLSLMAGIGITIYLVAWALVPNDKDEIVAQRALRDADGGSIVVIILAALSLFGGSAFGGAWGGRYGWGFPWGVFLIGLLVFWLVKRSGNADADQRVRAIQLGQPIPPGAPPTASAPTVPQTQVLARGQAAPQTQAALPTQAVPQTQVVLPTQAVPQTQVPPQSRERDRMRWEGTPGFPVGQGMPEGAARPSGPVAPQTRTVPKRPRRRSGGPLMALLAFGLALATYGALVWAGNALSWTGDHRTIAFAGALAAVGLLSVVLGIAGWRAGFVTFLAVALAITALSSTAVPAGININGRVGDATWTPRSVTTGANKDTYRLGVGNGVLDLGKLPTDGLSEAVIPTSVGLGELKVLVPPGLTVKVVGHVNVGEILAPGDPANKGMSGSDVSRTISVGDGPTEVVVDAGVGIGQLTVVKE